MRAKKFCDCYELSDDVRGLLVEVMIVRIKSLLDFMADEALKGNKAFIANIKDSHHLAYEEDINYLLRNKTNISNILLELV